MKISDQTLAILKNFSQINNSILFKKGNIIQTISVNNTVVGQAKVEETFEQDFAIYELDKFLNCLSLFENKEIFFSQNYLTIKSGQKNIVYRYAAKEMIKCAPYKEPNFPVVLSTFRLINLAEILKAGNILGVPDITFSSDEGHLVVKCENIENRSSDSYELLLSEEGDEDFKVSTKIENFKMINTDYIVKVSNKKIMSFETENGSLHYWIATES